VRAITLVCIWLGVLARLSAQTVTITPSRSDAIYRLGEPVRWQVAVTNAASFKNPSYTIKSGDLTTVASGGLTLANGAATLESSLSQPGWILLEVDGTDATGATLKTYGGAFVAPEQIARSAPRPDDFESWWQAKVAALANIPINPVLTPDDSGVAGVDHAVIQLDCINGTHVQGQIARPTTGTKFPALLIVQYAGVYALQKSWATSHAAEGWLVLNTEAHDIAPFQSDAYYTALANGALNNYPAIGADDRETSYFLRMFLAAYRAADYLTTRPDWDGRTLVVMGGSQGGLQTLVTAALHPKVTAALAEVPAGCDQSGMDAGRMPGWPVWPWLVGTRDKTKVMAAAQYFDPVNFTPMIRCPVLVGIGALDTAATPSGVYAAYNQLTGARQMVAMPAADHTNNHGPFYVLQYGWLADARTAKTPTLQTAPQSVAAKLGQEVTLSVVAANGQAYGYQWSKNGVALPGQTSRELHFTAVTAEDAADYAVTVTSPGGAVTSTRAHLAVASGAAIARPTALINLSARGDCGVGDNVAIGGFVIAGEGTKRLLVRAVGPSLAAQGLSVAEVLADPVLELHDALHGNAVIATADDWGEKGDAVDLAATAARVGAQPLQSGDYTSSAVLLELPAGVYSFVVSGKANGTGIVLLEVYDADPGITGANLINISARLHAGTGNKVAIGGFVVAGGAPRAVLMRAVGPTLATQNIAASALLQDPMLELHDALHGTIVGTNGDWTDQGAAIAATGAQVGAAPLAANDTTSAALVQSIAPGVYSFIAYGRADTSGIVLIETYAVPD